MSNLILPCRFCKAPAWDAYGGDGGKESTSIHCEGECKMSPMVSALYHNDAVKMWNAAMESHEDCVKREKLRSLTAQREILVKLEAKFSAERQISGFTAYTPRTALSIVRDFYDEVVKEQEDLRGE